MNMESRWVPSVAAALLLTLAVTQAGSDGRPSGSEVIGEEVLSAPHALIDVRIDSPTEGRTDVVLALDGDVTYQSLVLDGPDRLVLDLQGVVSRLDQYRFPVDRGGVVRVRAARRESEPLAVTRVVFDLERPLSYTIETRGSDLVVSFDTGPEPTIPAVEPTAVVAPEAVKAVIFANADYAPMVSALVDATRALREQAE